jgi:integrase
MSRYAQLADAVDRYVDDKRRGTVDSPGAYATNSRSVLKRVVAVLEAQSDVEVVDDLDDHDLRRLARFFRDVAAEEREPTVEDHGFSDGLAVATVENYWAIVRAWLEWCVREGLIDRNPSVSRTATEPLPDAETGAETVDRQYWPREEREKLVRWTRARVASAYASPIAPVDVRLQRLREDVLVQLLANSGVRAAEILSSSRDSRRDGLAWRDVHLVDDGENGEDVIHVLGKDQATNDVAVPSAVRESLLRMHRELDRRFDGVPEDWPVFPTRHRPTLSRTAREQLGDDRVDELLDELGVVELCIEHDVNVPSLSTNGGRRVMESLCKCANVDVDGEYLKPHGGRRALGREVFVEKPGAATELLRHKDASTTKESYAEVQRKEVREVVDDLREQ